MGNRMESIMFFLALLVYSLIGIGISVYDLKGPLLERPVYSFTASYLGKIMYAFLTVLLWPLVIVLRIFISPMAMFSDDVMGSLYSRAGLRFGGFQTVEFIALTKELEKARPGVREEIIAEAHYLATWPHRFPEVAFFIGTVISKSLLIGSIWFVAASIVETFRFYYLGPSILVSHVCRSWNRIKAPIFIGAAILFWSNNIAVSIGLVIFLIVQGWLGLFSNIFIIPIRYPLILWLSKRLKHTQIIQEGLALQWVINRWRIKVFHHYPNE